MTKMRLGGMPLLFTAFAVGVAGCTTAAQVNDVATPVGQPSPAIRFWADPNPIILAPGAQLGVTTVHVDAPFPTEVHVGSAAGPIFSQEGVGPSQSRTE